MSLSSFSYFSSLAEHMAAHPEEYRKYRDPYIPLTLPPLPRTHCPHMRITQQRKSDKQWNAIPAKCRGHVMDHGWCEEHRYSHELLVIGAQLGYPEVDLTIPVYEHGQRKDIGRWILSGVENWEVYAEYVSYPHAKNDVQRIRARYSFL